MMNSRRKSNIIGKESSMQDDVNRLLKDYGEEGIRVPDLVEA